MSYYRAAKDRAGGSSGAGEVLNVLRLHGTVAALTEAPASGALQTP